MQKLKIITCKTGISTFCKQFDVDFPNANSYNNTLFIYLFIYRAKKLNLCWQFTKLSIFYAPINIDLTLHTITKPVAKN